MTALTSAGPNAIRVVGRILATLLLCAGLAPAALAGDTGWLDRDDVSGKGDYEDTKSHFKIKCRLKDGPSPFPFNEPGYHCALPVGAYCVNADTSAGKCKDIEVNYFWSGGSTGWLDRDDVGGKGDYEDVKSHFQLECRIKNHSNLIPASNVKYNCKLPVGGHCVNGEPAGTSCEDLEVRYTW